MLHIVDVILMVLAVICLAAAAFTPSVVPGANRVSFGWLGLFFWALVVAIGVVS